MSKRVYAANNKVQQVKQDILELSVLKREIINEIKDIKLTYPGAGQNDLNEFPEESSQLRSADFEELSKEHLMSMLAKAQEEIIYLRIKAARQKTLLVESKEKTLEGDVSSRSRT